MSAIRSMAMATVVTAVLVLTGCGGPGMFTKMKANPQRAYVDARHVLMMGAESPDMVVRMHALESLSYIVGTEAGGAYMENLQLQTPAPASGASGPAGVQMVPVPGVQFAAAMAIGDCRYAPAKPKLLDMMESPQTPKSVQFAVVYALHQLGDDTYTGKLGWLLFDTDSEVRANAALAMGKMGNASAIRPLRAARQTEIEPKVNLQIDESLAALGDQKAFGELGAYTRAGFVDEQTIAVQRSAGTAQPPGQAADPGRHEQRP